MSSLVNYNVEGRQSSLGIDIEYATDPASGSFFNSDFKKHEDLKQMLDSNKDGLKLEAMKRIIGMLAKGKDASELFPAVVKNVVSANLEVKKLVYVYLVRYAEEQQDLALLSISTFQRGLKDPNPLIRACALRVLSSIRVQVIVPIMLLAIKETVTDLSPYVRKTTAHAIPKLHSLDPEQKEELIKVIEKLLSDMSTLVVGSAVMAFEEVCPERIDLIHTNYKKLCCLLVDVEEWGQVIIINMLTRYARTQFLDPNFGDEGDTNKEAPFYEDNSCVKEEVRKMDPDHRLLLANTKPLLQSRNAAVVMSVAQLYQHIAPHGEVNQAARALVRLLRSHREVQAVVLTNIATLSTQRKGMFEPFLKSFFIRSSDPTHIKILKLEVITNLAMESNIPVILREFQTYIWSADKEFVAATIQAIGRCASNIKEVTDSCLNGLVKLLSNKDESIVGESVVVVRKLLQNETVGHKDIITHMARLVDNIKMSTARASILWLLGEYCDKVPKLAPDVLRKMAKSFVNEADVVKLQIITLATKLYLTNPKQTHLLCQYIFNLAKYDMNYDIRDRARFIRAIIFPASKENSGGRLSRQAKKIFLASKPPPVQQSSFKDRDHYQLGTLSHFINAKANGYSDLPPFPEVAPDPSVRNQNTESPPVGVDGSAWSEPRKSNKKLSFYSDEEEDSSEEGDSDVSSDSESSSSSSESGTSDEFASDPSSVNESDDGEGEGEWRRRKSSSTRSSSSSSSSSTSSDSSETRSASERSSPIPMNGKGSETTTPKENNALDLLLDLSNNGFTGNEIETPVLAPCGDGLLDASSQETPPGSSVKVAKPMFIPVALSEVLNRLDGDGLSICTRFTRSPHLYSPSMTSVELTFKNEGSEEVNDVCVGSKRLAHGVTMHDFPVLSSLPSGSVLHATIGIDFNDSITPANFDILANGKLFPVTVTPSVGDLINAVYMSERDFGHYQMKLRGLNEHSGKVKTPTQLKNKQLLLEKLYQQVNVLQVPSTQEEVLKFAGETSSSKCVVLISIHEISGGEEVKVVVNCEKMMLASMLFKHIEDAFTK